MCRKKGGKNKTGVFVDYSDEVKGYRIYFSNNKKVEMRLGKCYSFEKQREKKMKMIMKTPE